MRKYLHLYIGLGLTIVMLLAMSGTVTFAGEKVSGDIRETETAAVEPVAVEDVSVEAVTAQSDMTLMAQSDDQHISVAKPKDNYTAYVGEKINFEFTMQDTYTSYRTRPVVRFTDSKRNPIKTLEDAELIPVDGKNEISGFFDLQSVSKGKYNIIIYCAAWDEQTQKYTLYEKYSATIPIKVRVLDSPDSYSLIAYKGKIKLVYDKAKGATKYEIFRSTKKKSGFKKIGSTDKLSFTDKKTKAGKTYYYKIRSLRDKNETIRSEFGPVGKMKAY